MLVVTCRYVKVEMLKDFICKQDQGTLAILQYKFSIWGARKSRCYYFFRQGKFRRV